MAPADEVLRVRVLDALQGVSDPEMGESIVALGLVERIEIGPAEVHVTLVPTSATCPMADVLMDDAEIAARSVCPPGTTASVEMDWATVWTPKRMSPELQRRFGWTDSE